MDENTFIDLLKVKFPFSRGEGIGDDTSIVRTGAEYQLITKDILIEDVHFDNAYFTPEEIALRSIGVNISDIAGMGGSPEYFYLGLGFPQSYRGDYLDRFFSGIKTGCKRWNVELAGGDLSSSPEKLFISITMIGSSTHPVKRNGACTGDLICITRVTGESAIGLSLLKKGVDIPYFTNKHKDANPEVVKGIVLSEYVSSMIDVSDGLLMDLGRLLKSSDKGGELIYEKLPVTDMMREACQKNGLSEFDLVLSGGEDFALLFTIRKENEKMLKKTGTEYYILGKVTDGRGIKTICHGKDLKIKTTGFDHFY